MKNYIIYSFLCFAGCITILFFFVLYFKIKSVSESNLVLTSKKFFIPKSAQGTHINYTYKIKDVSKVFV